MLEEGDIISLDGTLGEVYIGELKSEPPKPSQEFNILMEWSDEFRRLKVRANAETTTDTLKALEFGAEGIGLCRTEHMFFEGERIIPMREMIMSDSVQGRKRALKKLIKYQISDFESIFILLKDKPITVRLLDPPMHEFLPKSDIEMTDLANVIGVTPTYVREMLLRLSESNPMLGHRGVRLGLSYPEIYEMQVEAILRAAHKLYKDDGITITPEIMIPLVMNASELAFNDSKELAATIEPVQLSDAHQQYQFLSDESMRKVMVSHRIVSPMLVGIKDTSGLGNNAEELQTASVLMDNTVIRPMQVTILDELEKILEYNGIDLDIYFKTLQPLEFTDLTNAISEAEIEKETGVKKDIEEEVKEKVEEQIENVE